MVAGRGMMNGGVPYVSESVYASGGRVPGWTAAASRKSSASSGAISTRDSSVHAETTHSKEDRRKAGTRPW